jgi:hypothetical protein
MATEVEQAIEQTEQAVKKQFSDPYEFLATIPGAPSKDLIQTMKAQTPNQRIRVFSPDTKRVFLIRGISHTELNQVQQLLPINMSPEKTEQELYILIAARCTIWTNASATTKLNPDELRAGSAGLPSTLFQLVQYLSDYVEPESLNVLSAEL